MHLTEADWNIVNTIAQSVSAIGTLLAVVVSLYLARHQTALRLVVRTSVIFTVTPGVPGSQDGPFFSINIANAGFRDVTVTSLGWRLGWLRRRHFFQTLSLHALSGTLPRKLAPSETVDLVFPMQLFLSNTSVLRASPSDNRLRSWIDTRSLRLRVGLSTGEALVVRPPYAVQRRLRGGKAKTLPASAAAARKT
jgi:hypothetical protein